MKKSGVLSFAGVAVVMLVIGVALGSVVFAIRTTETTTEISSSTVTRSVHVTSLSTLISTSHEADLVVAVLNSSASVNLTKMIMLQSEVIYTTSGNCTAETAGSAILTLTQYLIGNYTITNSTSLAVRSIVTNTTENTSPVSISVPAIMAIQC